MGGRWGGSSFFGQNFNWITSLWFNLKFVEAFICLTMVPVMNIFSVLQRHLNTEDDASCWSHVFLDSQRVLCPKWRYIKILWPRPGKIKVGPEAVRQEARGEVCSGSTSDSHASDITLSPGSFDCSSSTRHPAAFKTTADRRSQL